MSCEATGPSAANALTPRCALPGGYALLIKRAGRIDELAARSRRLLAQLEQLEQEQRTLNLRDPGVIDEHQRRLESLRREIERLLCDR